MSATNDRFDTIEMLAFNLKLLSKKSRKNVLLSAGRVSDKERMLPAIEELAKLPINIYATPGTREFLAARGVACTVIHKITDGHEPNIGSFLKPGGVPHDSFDFIVNILTGNNNYDESSDSNLIRSLAIENGIPLITDVDVAILTIGQVVKRHTIAAPAKSEPWNLRAEFFRMVAAAGGFASYHAHYDKAYLISLENLKLGQVDMQKKWELYKYLKENYTHEDLVERISRAVEAAIAQGVTYARSMVDADSTVKLLPVQAALEVKERYKDRIHFEIGVQPLQGVLDRDSRAYYFKACELADTIGGLPSKDRPQPEKHLDYIMSVARDLGKRLDVHVDQENNPYECESELLALKTIEHGLQGRVSAIHAISLAAKPKHEQDRIISIMKDAGLSVICCPSAALSMKQLNMEAPLHNSIAPVPRLIEAGIPVYLGIDNIADLFMPVVDGDMWTECRVLMEACRYYDIGKVAEVACDKGGFN